MSKNPAQKAKKQPWEPMKLERVGHVGQVVQGGGGKTSIPFADAMDGRKPKGQMG